MMKRYLILLSVMLCCLGCYAQTVPKTSGLVPIVPGDTLSMVAHIVVWYDKDYAPYYQLDYRQTDDLYKNSPELIRKYGNAILKQYTMVKVQQQRLACYLYLLGEKEPLTTYNKSKMSQNSRESFDMMLKHFNIKLPKK